MSLCNFPSLNNQVKHYDYQNDTGMPPITSTPSPATNPTSIKNSETKTPSLTFLLPLPMGAQTRSVLDVCAQIFSYCCSAGLFFALANFPNTLFRHCYDHTASESAEHHRFVSIYDASVRQFHVSPGVSAVWWKWPRTVKRPGYPTTENYRTFECFDLILLRLRIPKW